MMSVISDRSWTGSALRSVSFDLDTRTLVLELYAQDASRCDRIVITNGDVAMAGSLDSTAGPAHCLVAEPSWQRSDGVATLTFTTPTLAITVSGGLVSVDSFEVDDRAAPLWITDAQALDDVDPEHWQRAA